jgi:hypothetical protein
MEVRQLRSEEALLYRELRLCVLRDARAISPKPAINNLKKWGPMTNLSDVKRRCVRLAKAAPHR